VSLLHRARETRPPPPQSVSAKYWRFQAKWRPVRVKKTRQIKNLEPRFDSIGTEKALVTMAGANAGFGDTHMFQQTAKTDPSKVTHLNRE